jgi:hypothetical protein
MREPRTPENGWTLRVYKYLFESEFQIITPPDLTRLEAEALAVAQLERIQRSQRLAIARLRGQARG